MDRGRKEKKTEKEEETDTYVDDQIRLGSQAIDVLLFLMR